MSSLAAMNSTSLVIDQLSQPSDLIDIRLLAKNFVEKRLQNTKSVEDIRAKALYKLSVRLDDPELKITTTGLLDIIDTLNNSSKEDMNTIMKASSGDSTKNPNGGSNYYNIFMPQGSQNTTPILNSNQFSLVEKLVAASAAIIENNNNS